MTEARSDNSEASSGRIGSITVPAQAFNNLFIDSARIGKKYEYHEYWFTLFSKP